jgi:uncharacterized protein (TIGR02996 family)
MTGLVGQEAKMFTPRPGLTEEDIPFLRALADYPSDEAGWQVYADWLEERGDVRGEYLRLERSLAAHPDQDERVARLNRLAPQVHPNWKGAILSIPPRAWSWGNPAEAELVVRLEEGLLTWQERWRGQLLESSEQTVEEFQRRGPPLELFYDGKRVPAEALEELGPLLRVGTPWLRKVAVATLDVCGDPDLVRDEKGVFWRCYHGFSDGEVLVDAVTVPPDVLPGQVPSFRLPTLGQAGMVSWRAEPPRRDGVIVIGCPGDTLYFGPTGGFMCDISAAGKWECIRG